MTQPSGGEFIGQIYDAALRPESWPDILAALADRVGGSSAWLSRLDVRTGNGSGLISRIDPSMPVLYQSYYGSINPIARVRNPTEFMRFWRPGILTDEDRMPKDELVRSEFYNDFLRPQDIHSTLMLRLAAKGSETTVINIHRTKRQGGFASRAIDELAKFEQHLRRAISLSDRLAETDEIVRNASEALDRSADAIFILDRRGRVKHFNAVADQLLKDDGCLVIVAGVLRARAYADDRALEALVAKAGVIEDPVGGGMVLSAVSGRAKVSLTIAPVRPDRLSLFNAGSSILVCVSGIPAVRSVSAQTLGVRFDLSIAEARVAAALLEGLTPSEVAARLGSSIHTVRSHLSRIYAKTDTRRQSELVALLLN